MDERLRFECLTAYSLLKAYSLATTLCQDVLRLRLRRPEPAAGGQILTIHWFDEHSGNTLGDNGKVPGQPFDKSSLLPKVAL